MDDLTIAGETIRRWFDAAVHEVDPRQAVVNALIVDDGAMRVDHSVVPLPKDGKVIVVAVGKAAGGMAQGAFDVLGDRIDRGIVLTKYGHSGSPIAGFEEFEAGHPVPDENGLLATRTILSAVEGLSADDLVIALISGGGSALLELPVEGVSLDDLRTTTRLLMHAGAGIHDLNAVRKSLSEVKGGGLRRAIGPARCVSLILSDVLGNDPTVIASGPTVLSFSPGMDASSVIDRFGIGEELPGSVAQALDRERDRAIDIDTSQDVVFVIADNGTFIRAIERSAREEGHAVRVEEKPFDGDAATFGRALAQEARESPAGIDVILRGGEATVTVTGDGTGGRNTEMALAAAIELAGDVEWIIASLASDGDDGNSSAAGAIADGDTVARARAVGVDPVAALGRNDSASVFRSVGGIVDTGPTGTNVNDVYIALRRRALTAERGSL